MGLAPFGVVEGTTFFNLTRIQDVVLQGSEVVEEYAGDYGTVKSWDEEGRTVEVWVGEEREVYEGKDRDKVKKKKRKGVNDAGLLSFGDEEEEVRDAKINH